MCVRAPFARRLTHCAEFGVTAAQGMSRAQELIAAGHTEREIGQMLGADSLRYLSLVGLRRAMGQPDGNGFCFACFTGSYPVDVPAQLEMDKLALEIPVAVSS